MSKLAIVSLVCVFLITGIVLYVSNNKSSADTIIPADSSKKPTPQIDENQNLASFDSSPILMYHYIRTVTDINDTLGADLSVSPSIFDKQIKYLADNNYQSISLSQMREGFQGKKVIENGKKPIVITFDDGYDDAYTQAYPILKKYNMIGVFYIISGQIGQSERMTKSQIIELDKNNMIIGSHTENHLSLTNITSADLNNQLDDSKKTLEQLLGHTVSDFCYPAGKYNDGVAVKVENSGYLTATTTKNGIANKDNNFFELPRIRMQNNTDLAKVLK